MWFASPAAGLPSRTIMELPPCVETDDAPSELLNRLSAQRNELRRRLHRTRDRAVIDKNRGVAVPACRVVKTGYKSPDSCDEYPFASTVEGEQFDLRLFGRAHPGEGQLLLGFPAGCVVPAAPDPRTIAVPGRRDREGRDQVVKRPPGDRGHQPIPRRGPRLCDLRR
ncbi:NucA/NucB deoxyribonuclease domain-containing protein [Streptosporangium canum]